jgi:hypothetical protein
MVGIPAQLLLIFIKTGSWMFRPHAFDRGQGLVGLRPYASLGSVEIFGDGCADCERGLDLLVVRAAARVEALDLDLDLDFVMGSSEVMRRHPPHHLSPARGKTPAGQDPEARIRHFKSP